MIVGTWLTFSPFLGLLGTVLGMQRAFKELGAAGATDPSILGAAVGETLVSAAAGLLLCPVGLVTLGFSIYFYLKNKTAPPQGDAAKMFPPDAAAR